MSNIECISCGADRTVEGSFSDKMLIGICIRCRDWSGFRKWRQSDGCGCIYYDTPDGIEHEPCEKHEKEVFESSTKQ